MINGSYSDLDFYFLCVLIFVELRMNIRTTALDELLVNQKSNEIYTIL